MAEENDVGKLFADIDRLIGLADEAARDAEPSRERVLLQVALENLKRLRAAVPEVVPRCLQGLQEVAGQVRDRGAAAAAAGAAAAARLAERRASGPPPAPRAAPPPLATAVPPIDPALGAGLREGLLAALGLTPGVAAPPPGRGRDVWEDWDAAGKGGR